MIKNTKKLNPNDIRKLYEANEWYAYLNDFDSLLKGIENSLDCYAYFDNDVLVGLIRTIGDGYTVVYVQDILLLPEYQNKGIGTTLLKTILEKYEHVRQIVLMTDKRPEQLHFYRKNGFIDVTEIGCTGFTFNRNQKS